MKLFRAASVTVVALTAILVARQALMQPERASADNSCPPSATTCEADPSWFPATPRPAFAKPNPKEDCDFYRPAWQYLLYLVQEETPGDGPRLFALDHPEDLFGRPAHTRFPAAKKGSLRLAPRLGLERDPLAGAEVNQAQSRGILVDPTTGRAIYYSIHLNEVFSKFIRDNHYDQALNLKDAPADQEFPRGAAEFKTSWRILPDGDDGDGYITATATISKLTDDNGDIKIDPQAIDANRKAALLGIHVVFVLDGHPEFVWATFEHKDNAPSLNKTHVDSPPGAAIDATPVDATRNWLLYRKGTAAAACNVNNKGMLALDAAKQTLSPRTDVFRQFQFGNDEDPSVIPLLNCSVHKRIADALPAMPDGEAKKRFAALQNYQLVGAMWLNNTAYFREGVDFALLDEECPNEKILGGDEQLSNSTIETFTQKWLAMTPAAGGAEATRNSRFCFDCHATLAESKKINGTLFTLPAKRLNVSHVLVQQYFQAVAQSTKAP